MVVVVVDKELRPRVLGPVVAQCIVHLRDRRTQRELSYGRDAIACSGARRSSSRMFSQT